MPTSGKMWTVESIAQLRAIPVAQVSAGTLLCVVGYHTLNDGGGGLFVYDPSSSAEDGGTSFRPAVGRGRYLRLIQDPSVVRAAWFGAKNDGIHPAHREIQRAIDYALQYGIRDVHLECGLYRIEDTLHLGYGQTFSEVSLIGAGRMYRAEPAFGGTALLVPFHDRPAIAVQGARISSVRSLSLRGPNFDHVQQTFEVPGDLPTRATDFADPLLWVDPTFPTAADSRYAPCCAIAIDPYAGVRPAISYPDVSYPPWTWTGGSPPAQYGKVFSSAVEIFDVYIGGFVAGVVLQPCDADGNGDFTKIHRCMFELGRYGISVCNTQSRNVSIRDCEYAWLHTFLTNSAHGRRSGRLDGPIDNVSGGVSYQLVEIGALTSSGPLRFRHIYFEAQVRFGTLGTAAASNCPVVLEGCTVGTWSDFGHSPGSFIQLNGETTLQITGCQLYFPHFMVISGLTTPVLVDGCSIANAVWDDTWRPIYQQQMPQDISLAPQGQAAQNYLCGGLFCTGGMQVRGSLNGQIATSVGVYGAYRFQSTVTGNRAIVHCAAEKLSYTSGTFPDHAALLRGRKPVTYLNKAGFGDTANVSFAGASLSFDNLGQQISYASHVQPGDLLLDAPTATLFVVREIVGLRVTAEIVTNYQIVQGVKVPLVTFQPSSGYLLLYPCTALKTRLELRGNTTAGSPVITMVRRPDGYGGDLSQSLAPGDLLYWTGERWDLPQTFPQITRVESVVDGVGGGTVTVSQAAYRTASDVPVTMVW